jgi:hypothetical protein
MDKAQFLREQSNDALAAMRATLRDAKSDAIRCVDPRGWARKHPWKAVAAAAGSGFVAGELLRRPAGEPKSSRPKEPSHVGRFLVRALKRGIRVAIAIAQPIAQELWAAHMASVNSAPNPRSDGQETSPPPAPGPSETSNRP